VHILTKIFIVLVSLLAVAMVPLVATYTSNENSYKSMYRASNDQQLLAQSRASDAEQALISQQLQMQQDIDAREATIGSLRLSQSSTRASIESMNDQIRTLKSQLDQSNANLQALSTASQVNSELKERFVKENYELREKLIKGTRQVMEMEDTLEQIQYEADEAERAKRKATEERRLMETQLIDLSDKYDAFVAKYGELEVVAAVETGVAPNKTLTGTVLQVSRADENVLIEINVGSRDGVQEGWVMTVGDDGTFLGRLLIHEVDINRSVGRVTLEDASRCEVVVGSTVYSVKGRN
jgi:predicted RNase H-like nuclease (RuvC/YqgF family)